ncbi:MAG: hypothetical protein F6J93_29585 [Oscillatoria sp. SIO1A7]|nr:hypothetical protein [Oscillatoria sp. SIO1A7]
MRLKNADRHGFVSKQSGDYCHYALRERKVQISLLASNGKACADRMTAL